MNEIIQKQYEKEPKRWYINLAIALLIVIILVWSSSIIQIKSTSNGGKVALNIILGIIQPDVNLLLNFTNKGIAYLLLETICIAFLGTIVGSVLSIPLSFLASTNIVPRYVAVVFRTMIMAIRTIPPLIYGLMFIRVTGGGAFTGLLTMSVCSIGMLSKLFIEAIEDLDVQILESLDAAGCNTFQKIRYGILPQLFSGFLSTIIYRFDMNLRDATVLGLVGAGGIGAPLMFAMSSYKWHQVGSILVGLIILILLIEFFSTRIRVKLARG